MPAGPTSPYCTSTLVVYLLRQLVPTLPADFSAVTVPAKAEVDQSLIWTGSEINMALRAFGYVIPLATHPDDSTWPTDQTAFLQFLNGVGASGYLMRSMKPAPAVGPGKEGAADSLYRSEFYLLLDRIRRGELILRANYYLNTQAEQRLAVPRAPQTDFGRNIIDPQKYQLLTEYTEMVDDVRQWMSSLNLYWNYLYSTSGRGPAI